MRKKRAPQQTPFFPEFMYCYVLYFEEPQLLKRIEIFASNFVASILVTIYTNYSKRFLLTDLPVSSSRNLKRVSLLLYSTS